MTSLLYFDKLLQIPMMLLKNARGIDMSARSTAFIDPPPGVYPLLDELAGFFATEPHRSSRRSGILLRAAITWIYLLAA